MSSAAVAIGAIRVKKIKVRQIYTAQVKKKLGSLKSSSLVDRLYKSRTI